MAKIELRPSSLPKLALCGHYQSDPVSGDAAARGTRLDAIFRDAVAGKPMPLGDMLSEDIDAVKWAISATRVLGGDASVETDESNLQIECCGMTGTADALCSEKGWSADLKTGQVRNYMEQQAAYALGFMDAHFADEWTVYLLFCDEREIVTLRFTRDEAERIVRGVIAAVHDECQPRVNEYCGWCAARFTCSARLEAVQVALGNDGAPDFANSTGIQLRDFVLRAKVVEDFAEQARDEIKARLIAQQSIPGCSLVSKQGPKKFPARELEMDLARLGSGNVLAAFGLMSADKARDLYDRAGLPFPETKIEQMPGSVYPRVSQPKTEKTK